MSDSLRQRVHTLGLTLPTPSLPAANYISHVISGKSSAMPRNNVIAACP